MVKKITVTVPGSTANIGAGFDCLSIALSIYNHFEFEMIDKGLEVIIEGEGAEYLPTNDNNIVVKSAQRVFELCNKEISPLRVKIKSNLPLARGLGSSATAIIGAMVAANYFCDNKLSEEVLLNEIVKVEGHPDNVVASYYGGLTATCIVDDKILHIKYNISKDVRLVLCVPDFKLSTIDARSAIPQVIPHKDAVFNLTRVPFIIDKLVTGNLENLSSVVEDKLHQNYRKHLIPFFNEVVSSAYDAGAKGVALSGAGPTILAITKDNPDAISEAMVSTFRSHKIISKGSIVAPDNDGVKIELS